MAIILRKDVSENWFSNIQYPSTPSNSHQRDNDDKPHDFSSIVIHKGVSFSDNGEVYGFRKPHCHVGCLKIRYPKPMDAHHFPKLPFMGITPFQTHPDTFFIDCLRINLNFKFQLSRAKKPISFAMSLGYAYAGACALLTRTQCYLTRQQWEKTSLRGAYALGNVEKMIPHHRFCLRHRLFSPSNMFAASALWGWRRARGRRRGRRATRIPRRSSQLTRMSFWPENICADSARPCQLLAWFWSQS